MSHVLTIPMLQFYKKIHFLIDQSVASELYLRFLLLTFSGYSIKFHEIKWNYIIFAIILTSKISNKRPLVCFFAKS